MIIMTVKLCEIYTKRNGVLVEIDVSSDWMATGHLSDHDWGNIALIKLNTHFPEH